MAASEIGTCMVRDARRRAPHHEEREQETAEESTMKLTQAQIDYFNREGWLFLPELFAPEEVALLAAKPSVSTTPIAPRCGAKKAARRARPLPRISTMKPSAC